MIKSTGVAARRKISPWAIGFAVVTTAVGFVGLVIAHIYFALRPEKLWITKSMIFGTITRREYLEYHDPDRWVADGRDKSSRSPVA